MLWSLIIKVYDLVTELHALNIKNTMEIPTADSLES